MNAVIRLTNDSSPVSNNNTGLQGNNDPDWLNKANQIINDPATPQWEKDYYEQAVKLYNLEQTVLKQEQAILDQLTHVTDVNQGFALLMNLMGVAGEKLEGLSIQLNAVGDLRAALTEIQKIYNSQSGLKTPDKNQLLLFIKDLQQFNDVVSSNPGNMLDSNTQEQLKDTIGQFAGRWPDDNLLDENPGDQDLLINMLMNTFPNQGLGDNPDAPGISDKEKQADMATLASLTAGATTSESTQVTTQTQNYQACATTLVNTSNTINALGKQMVNAQRVQ